MTPTLPCPSPPAPGNPGTVRVTLRGNTPDLVKLTLFLEGVTRGEAVADVLLDVELAAIVITETRGTSGRAGQITMLVELREFA